MSTFGWLILGAWLSPLAVLPAVAVAWRAERAVRARWQMRALDRDLRRVLYDS